MKLIILSSFSIALMATSLSAAITFNIDGIGSTASANPSAGAVTATDTSSGDGVVNASVSKTTLDLQNSGTITVSLSSITLDGVGVDDDTATLVFSIASAGGTIDDNGSDFGVDGNGAGRISDASESITFAFDAGASSISLGAGATETGTINFLGFNQISLSQFDNVDGDVGTITLGGVSQPNLTDSTTNFGVDSGAMVIGYSAGGATNDGFKINHFRARFEFDTVVPEPSAYALIGGLFALAAVMVRRRK